MNKKQLIAKVAQKTGNKIVAVERIMDSALNFMMEALSKGEKVRLVGFGNFVVRTRAPRIGRNPQTGEKISIPSSKAPAFVPGINLKKRVKGK